MATMQDVKNQFTVEGYTNTLKENAFNLATLYTFYAAKQFTAFSSSTYTLVSNLPNYTTNDYAAGAGHVTYALGEAFLLQRLGTSFTNPKSPLNISQKLPTFEKGSFSVSNWKGYPEGGIKPVGPFRLLEGTEYKAARNLANSTNATMRKANPTMFKDLQIHEIHPVKFGGSPTDLSNKIFLTQAQHTNTLIFGIH